MLSGIYGLKGEIIACQGRILVQVTIYRRIGRDEGLIERTFSLNWLLLLFEIHKLMYFCFCTTITGHVFHGYGDHISIDGSTLYFAKVGLDPEGDQICF